MDRSALSALIFIFVLISSIVWWFKIKGAPYRNKVLMISIFCTVTLITGILTVKLSSGPLAIICIILCIMMFTFLISSVLAEHKYKQK
jgi:hypothetical protein